MEPDSRRDDAPAGVSWADRGGHGRLSRVVVGAHLPLDVVGGAALGLALAYGWHAVVGVDSTAAARSSR